MRIGYDERGEVLRRLLWILGVCLLPVAGTLDANDERNVAPNPGFEIPSTGLTGWYPVGVWQENSPYGLAIDPGIARSGQRSLKITPGPAGLAPGVVFYPSHNGGEGHRPSDMPGAVRGARTFAMRLEPGMTRIAASAWVRKPNNASASVSFVWTTRKDRKPAIEISRRSSTQITRSENGWNLYELVAERPAAADRVQFVVETDSSEPIHLDDVQLQFHLAPHVELLVDQLGYEPSSSAKTVFLQSTTPLENVAPARLLDVGTGRIVKQLEWRAFGYLPTWDRYYWRADLSAFRRPGRYRIEMSQGQETIASPAFILGENLLIDHTAQPGYRFYYYQRCGCEIPGFHAACHLDDAKLPDGTRRDLTGGWHDAGDYNKYNGLTPEAVDMLAYAYQQKPELFDRWDEDKNSRADILDEALWGARFVRKMLDEDRLQLLNAVFSGYRYWGPPEKETDNRPGTSDDRPVQAGEGDLSHCGAGFAILGHALVSAAPRRQIPSALKATDTQFGRELIALAERLYDKTGGGIDRLVPLYAATGNKRYRQAAEKRARELLNSQNGQRVVGFCELAKYALAFPGDDLAAAIRPLAARRVAELAELCDPLFGIACQQDSSGQFIYFRPYNDVNDWYVGDTSLRLDAAIDALYAARLGAPDGKTIAERQIHWLLGCNPFGISYMEGTGSHFVPGYHHRYNAIAGNPRGAVPGALINGMIRPWPHVDRPWLDLHPEPNADYHSNEPWLLHNNRWLQLIALW